MLRMFSILVGCVLLGAAAALFWIAKGPPPTEQRTTGGVLYTQQEIASQGIDQMQVVIDDSVGTTSTSIVGAPEVSSDAANDMASLDAQEVANAPDTTQGISPNLMTNDIMLDESTGVQVAPLDIIQPLGTAVPDGQGGVTSTGTYEQRVVELEWPTTFRVGQADTVRIKFRVLSGGAIQPVAEIANHEVLGTPILVTDRYDVYDATVTAEISAPDFSVRHLTNTTQTLERGSEPEWRWSLESNKAQSAVIVLTLSITWTPKAGGTPLQTTLWGQSLQVEVNYVFGQITVPQASYIGTGLAVLGIVAQIPLLSKILDGLWDAFFGGRRRRRSRQQSRSRR